MDCADFALHVLIEFASRRRLRLVVKADGVTCDWCMDQPTGGGAPQVNWRNRKSEYQKWVWWGVKSSHFPASTRALGIANCQAGDYLVYPVYSADNMGHVRVIYKVSEKAVRGEVLWSVGFCQGYDPRLRDFVVVCFTCPYGHEDPTGTDCATYYGAGPYDLKGHPTNLVGNNPRRWHQLP